MPADRPTYTCFVTRLASSRSFDDGMDAWTVADAAPASILSDVITHYSWWRESTGSFDTRQELASTCGVFIVNLGAPLEVTDARRRTTRLEAGQAFIGGMAQGTSLSRSTGQMEGIHVFMPILELARVMAVSIADLSDRTIPLDEVLGSKAGELGDRLLAEGSTDARLDVLDAFFAERVRIACQPEPLMAEVMCRLRVESVSATAEGIGWSRKRLAAWFRDRTGLLPAQYIRLARFERFADAMQCEPRASLAQLAGDAGYADQAHLNHDVRRLAGLTPGGLRARLLPAGGGVRD